MKKCRAVEVGGKEKNMKHVHKITQVNFMSPWIIMVDKSFPLKGKFYGLLSQKYLFQNYLFVESNAMDDDVLLHFVFMNVIKFDSWKMVAVTD